MGYGHAEIELSWGRWCKEKKGYNPREPPSKVSDNLRPRSIPTIPLEYRTPVSINHLPYHA